MSRIEHYSRIGFLFLLAIVPAQASLIITPYFDGTITSDPKAGQIESVINQAVSNLEGMISNNINVSIYFQEGGGLGESNYYVNLVTYKSFYDGLVANNANPAAIAALQANGGNGDTNGGVNPVTGGGYLEVKSANERAVGITQAPQCYVSPTAAGTSGGNVPNQCGAGPVVGALQTPVDAIVSLNVPITTVGTGSYDLLSTAEHEMDEVLGLGSALDNVSAASGTYSFSNDTLYDNPAILAVDPEDLYRWNAKTGGSRSTGTNCASPSKAYFSYGPSTGVLEQFNNSCNDADFGDWAPGTSAHIQDAVATSGAAPTYSAAELDALSAVGYNLINPTPEPSTWAMMTGSLLFVGLIGRKRLVR